MRPLSVVQEYHLSLAGRPPAHLLDIFLAVEAEERTWTNAQPIGGSCQTAPKPHELHAAKPVSASCAAFEAASMASMHPVQTRGSKPKLFLGGSNRTLECSVVSRDALVATTLNAYVLRRRARYRKLMHIRFRHVRARESNRLTRAIRKRRSRSSALQPRRGPAPDGTPAKPQLELFLVRERCLFHQPIPPLCIVSGGLCHISRRSVVRAVSQRSSLEGLR